MLDSGDLEVLKLLLKFVKLKGMLIQIISQVKSFELQCRSFN